MKKVKDGDERKLIKMNHKKHKYTACVDNAWYSFVTSKLGSQSSHSYHVMVSERPCNIPVTSANRPPTRLPNKCALITMLIIISVIYHDLIHKKLASISFRAPHVFVVDDLIRILSCTSGDCPAFTGPDIENVSLPRRARRLLNCS